MRISLPADPQTLNPLLFSHSTQLQFLWDFLFASLGPPSLQILAASTLLWTVYQAGCYPEVWIINFVNAQSWGIHPSIGHKLCRRRIPPKESPDNKSTLVWKTFSSCAGVGTPHRWCHRAQRCLVRNGWENRGCLKFHQLQNGFWGCPESL